MRRASPPLLGREGSWILMLWAATAVIVVAIPAPDPPGPLRPSEDVLRSATGRVQAHIGLYSPYTGVQGPAQLPLGLPVAAPVSSGFGMRLHPRYNRWRRHAGLDLAVPVGTPVRTTAAGWVARVRTDAKGYGLYVDVEHPVSGYRTRYAHLSDAYVRDGQAVLRGMVLGRSGASGNATGAHVHYEVRTASGRAVDPAALITCRGRC